MARPMNADLTVAWKNSLPATLAGKVEFLLFDNVHNKPKYGARGRLIAALLEQWVAQQEGTTIPPLPSLQELKEM